MPSFRGSSQPRDQTQASWIAGRFFTIRVTREALCYYYIVIHNEIILQFTIMQNEWEPWACFPATRWSHFGVMGEWSVQSLSVFNSLWSHGLQHASLPCPSPTYSNLPPRTYSNSCPSSRWCYPTISSSVVPFSSLLWGEWSRAALDTDEALLTCLPLTSYCVAWFLTGTSPSGPRGLGTPAVSDGALLTSTPVPWSAAYQAPPSIVQQ